jgi:uncharacterized repeat protein (TIGR03803 family)
MRSLRVWAGCGWLAVAAVGCGNLSAQTVNTFYNFTANDGEFAQAGLVQASDGNLYGTQLDGGADGKGVIYRISLTGTEEVFHSFTGTDGANPESPVYQATDGFLYGMTGAGGANGTGAIFKISLAGVLTTIYSFPAMSSGGGESPAGRLIQGSDGNFYGTTYNGGSAGLGTVFKMTPGGTVTILHSLGSDTDGNDGEFSNAGLVQASDGNYYGMSVDGGSQGNGDIFEISSGAYSIPFDFVTGSQPADELIEGANGALYGTTQTGGNTEGGTAFTYSTGAGYTFLHAFTDATDGQNPEGALFWASDGNLYGTTESGGPNGGGTLFRMSAAGTVDVLGSLSTSSGLENLDAGFVQASDGNLYAPTIFGGTASSGGIVQVKFTPAMAGPVVLTPSTGSLPLGQAFTLSFAVSNAFSVTAQQCFASAPAGAGAWSGVQTGTLSGSLYSGSASITPTATGTYTYALTCGGQESGFATLTVTGALPATTTTLVATPNPANIGQSVTLKATVAKQSGSGAPTGSVKFVLGSDTLATVALKSGVATLTAPSTGLPAGDYAITAEYGGDSGDAASQGSTTVTLDKNTTTAALTVTPNPVPANSSVTLKTTVKRADGTGFATGTVTIYAGTTALASSSLNSAGVATLTASSDGVAAATYPLHAVYAGDAADNGSTSATANVVVQ